PEDPRALLRPYPGRQAVRRVVRLLERLLRRAEGEDREHRPEDLLARDPVRLAHAGEEGGTEPEAALREAAFGLVDLGALLDPRRDELLDLRELRRRVDGADVRVLVERVAHPKRAQPLLQLVEDRLEDRLLHEQPRPRAAHVTLVEVDAVHD